MESPPAVHSAATAASKVREHNLRVLLEQRERRIERIACRIRIGVTLVAMSADTVTAVASGDSRAAVVLALAGLVYIGVMIGAHVLVGRDPYRPWIKYATTSFDFVVLAGLTAYWTGGSVHLPLPPLQMAAAMLAFVPVVNLLNGLRVGRPIIVYSTVLAVAASTFIGAWAGLGALAIGYLAGIMIASGALALVISTSTNRLFQRFARRNELTRFLPRELVERVDKGQMSLELGGTDHEVTVLMSDIRGFTTLSETRSPVEVVNQLNEYFTAMSEVIFAHGGSIDKYIGDAILAVFGVPEPRPDDARRALAAAQQMLERLVELNAQWQARDMPALKIGVGLHTGSAVAGNIGAPQRMEFTVIGDTVNVASRIEGLTKKYHHPLLFSETTRGAIGDGLEASLVDDADIRGRAGKIRVYTRA